MKITCPHCDKVFELTRFLEGFVPSGRDPDTGEQLYEEEQSCYCPYCNWLIYREDIDESELMDIQIEEAKREHPEIFEDQEDFHEQDNDGNE